MPVVPEDRLVEIDCPNLCEIDKKIARDCLMAAIAFFSNTLNQQRAMTPEQIKVMAYDMVDEFPNDSTAFIKLFFKKLRSGAFGNIYGTVDELTILDKYRKYRREVVTRFPLRKPQEKPKEVEEVKALPEADDRIPLPDWLAEKWGVDTKASAQPAQTQPQINPRHAEFAAKLKEAKTEKERLEIMDKYLNS